MNKNQNYICELANFLIENNKYMSAIELTEHLNRNGLVNTLGKKYKNGRGIYRLISSTYKALKKENKDIQASSITKVFVRANGKYAYLRYSN